jgi:GAF domain-containing protein
MWGKDRHLRGDIGYEKLTAFVKKLQRAFLFFDVRFPYFYEMAEELHITKSTKAERYQELLPQLKALLQGETDQVACMANTCAALRETFQFFWVGFYIVRDFELVLGPFQGPIACTRISKGKGVCGTAWDQKQILVVRDVDAFPGHIACSSLSKSEIVVPLFDASGDVVGVLDVDSERLADFDETDAHYLNEVVQLISL